MKSAKRLFTPQADADLMRLVSSTSDNNWQHIASSLPYGYTARQCRERWRNYLDPRLERSSWTSEEDQRLLSEYERIGNKWTTLASLIHGRSANCVRNRCFMLLRRREKGIVTPNQETLDPATMANDLALCEPPTLIDFNREDSFTSVSGLWPEIRFN
jgi:hypothetical protein